MSNKRTVLQSAIGGAIVAPAGTIILAMLFQLNEGKFGAAELRLTIGSIIAIIIGLYLIADSGKYYTEPEQQPKPE